jgi:serine/threonine-protein phosphatase 2A regulatory subunit B
MNLTWCGFVLQFDYLKSLEIEEKINKIRWCQTANGARFLLSTNDKTIKLWKVSPAKGARTLV